jgi:hypothetical protein
MAANSEARQEGTMAETNKTTAQPNHAGTSAPALAQPLSDCETGIARLRAELKERINEKDLRLSEYLAENERLAEENEELKQKLRELGWSAWADATPAPSREP